jgi:hypothetical protein
MRRLEPTVYPARFFLLVAMLGLAPSPREDGTARPIAGRDRGLALVILSPPAVGSPTSTSFASFRRLSPWRHRLKSVLEDTDARGHQPVALGLVVMPDPADISVVYAPRAARSRVLIPLRC